VVPEDGMGRRRALTRRRTRDRPGAPKSVIVEMEVPSKEADCDVPVTEEEDNVTKDWPL